MRDRFDQFFRLDSIFHGSAEMKAQLVGTIQRNQCRHGNKAAIALGQLLAFPYIIKEQLDR